MSDSVSSPASSAAVVPVSPPASWAAGASAAPVATSVRTLIVGAGLSGLGLLQRILSKEGPGASVAVVEKGHSVGGTWFWNRYPGARCDVESFEYCFKGDEALIAEWDFTEKYSTQQSIEQYLKHYCQRYQLDRHLHFNTKVTGATWSEEHSRWLVHCEGPISRYSAQFVVLATGCLSVPTPFPYPGGLSFAGRILRTSSWPQDCDVSLFKGLRVGVVGTGSSAIQCIPILAANCASLKVFQRQAGYCVPANNVSYDASTQAEKKAKVLEVHKHMMTTAFGIDINTDPRPFAAIPAAEFQASCEARWNAGGFTMMGVAADIAVNVDANKAACDFIRGKIRSLVKDPKTAALLCPAEGLLLGCKRMMLGTNYYDTYNEPHVSLVDIASTQIAEIVPSGLKMADGTMHELDIIVFATGFDALAGTSKCLKLVGREGKLLSDLYEHGPKTFLGLVAPGFPNLIHMNGPQSPSVLTNMITAAETHADWIANLLAYLQAKRLHVVDTAPSSADEWTGTCNAIVAHTIIGHADCLARSSWYWGSNVPGKPRAFGVFLGGVNIYNQKLQEVAAKDYEGFILQ